MSDDWKYDIEEFEDADDGTADSADGRARDVLGEAGATDIEPGSPSLENALFVCLGVAVALVAVFGI